MTRRPPGHASVEEHPKGSGRYRVRATVDGKLKTIASGLTEAVAKETADAYAVIRNETVLHEGVTLEQFGVGFLDRRELAGIRGIKKDRSCWRAHVASAPIAALAVSTLTRRDVIEWRDALKGKYRTRLKALNLLRVALAEAVDRELLKANPARDVVIHRAAAATDEDDLEGVLNPDEQRRLIEAVPEPHRAAVVFSLCTGLRQAEQWWLKWSDVLADRVVVRRSVGGKPPKSGKPRHVFLLPPAAFVVKALPRRAEWVFPAVRGGRRPEGKAPKGWHRWIAKAGITRTIRWHDLRHTCATSLLAGWWGRKWTLDEVCKFMGHSSVTVTERYARKLNETQELAVAATPMLEFPAPSHPKELSAGADSGIRTRDHRFTNGAKSRAIPARSLGGVFPRGNIVGTPGAWALALAAESALRPKVSVTLPVDSSRPARKKGARHAG
jgi:integrase